MLASYTVFELIMLMLVGTVCVSILLIVVGIMYGAIKTVKGVKRGIDKATTIPKMPEYKYQQNEIRDN